MTPHSTRSTGTLNGTNVHTVVALVNGRGNASGEVGLASLALGADPELYLTSFSDNSQFFKLMTCLDIVEPSVIVIPITLQVENPNLYEILTCKPSLKETQIYQVERKNFNSTLGEGTVQRLCVPEDAGSLMFDLKNKYYSKMCCHALIKYIEYNENIKFANSSLRITFTPSAASCMIDSTTAKNLELLNNLTNTHRHLDTLFGVMDKTQTKIGRKMLRANILQPPCDPKTVSDRLDCVDWLVEHQSTLDALLQILNAYQELDSAIYNCIVIPKTPLSYKHKETRIGHIIAIKSDIELIYTLRGVLQKVRGNPMLQALHLMIDDRRFESLHKIILNVISSDVSSKKIHSRDSLNILGAVRADVPGDLGNRLRLYRELQFQNVRQIEGHVEALARKHGSSFNLILSHNKTLGFHLKINFKGATPDLPVQFVNVKRYSRSITTTTEHLLKLNDRNDHAYEQVIAAQDEIIKCLLEEIRADIGALYKLTEAIAQLDFITGLASVCIERDYVKPELKSALAIEDGCHPILHFKHFDGPIHKQKKKHSRAEADVTQPKVTANSTFLGSGNSNLMIITGPNMGGKSTYIKQCALLQIMVQCGCWVPAKRACFTVIEQIFSRIGSDDSIDEDGSTFSLECKEMSYIFDNCNERSLVLIDEFGRGTSPEEGLGLAYAGAEKLMNSKALTLYVTHFREICQLAELHPQVITRCFESMNTLEKSNGDNNQISSDVSWVEQQHKLREGINDDTDYGIQLAETTALPPSIISVAKRMREKLCLQNRNVGLEKSQRLQAEFLVHRTFAELMLICNSRKDSSMPEIVSLLLTLQRRFL